MNGCGKEKAGRGDGGCPRSRVFCSRFALAAEASRVLQATDRDGDGGELKLTGREGRRREGGGEEGGGR